MRLIQFVEKSSCLRPPYHRIKCSIGAFLTKNDDTLVNLSAACELEKHGVNDMVSLLMQGPEFMKTVQRAVQSDLPKISRSDVRILPPVSSPDKILCVGMNYADHCAEQNAPIPTEPVIFNKFPPALVGVEDDVVHPDVTKKLDWEVELAMVIGKTVLAGSNPDSERASAAIAGYALTLDMSAREWQTPKINAGQWIMCKGMDSFCPIGPSLVTANEFNSDFASKVAPYSIGCSVNGISKQASTLTQLIFKPVDVVKYCSKFWSLLPGDVILTGTPPGVGFCRKPPEFLKRGDVVSSHIENIGELSAKIV